MNANRNIQVRVNWRSLDAWTDSLAFVRVHSCYSWFLVCEARLAVHDAEVDQAGLGRLVPFEVGDNHAAPAAAMILQERGRGIEDEVSEAVEDRLAAVGFGVLDHVGVMADHHIGACIDGCMSHRGLPGGML